MFRFTFALSRAMESDIRISSWDIPPYLVGKPNKYVFSPAGSEPQTGLLFSKRHPLYLDPLATWLTRVHNVIPNDSYVMAHCPCFSDDRIHISRPLGCKNLPHNRTERSQFQANRRKSLRKNSSRYFYWMWRHSSIQCTVRTYDFRWLCWKNKWSICNLPLLWPRLIYIEDLVSGDYCKE